MDIVHERAAGLDISKRDAKVCVRIPGTRAGTYISRVTTWGATTQAILELREFLEHERVTAVVMEATSDYWKPFFYLFEETLPVMLVNAKAARNIPGRKTDVSDAAWLAQLAAYGLLRGSFVPPEPIRELRDLTRARAIAGRDRTREIQRLEKFLESSGIKLSSVVSDLVGISSREMLEALISGERDPEVLAAMARGTLRSRIPALVDALTGRFKPHHAFMARLYLDQIDAHTRTIEALTARIEEAMEPFREAREALATIPGVSLKVAEVIIAETGADMRVFETPARLASWVGVCPSANESAGHIKSAHILPGNKYLKAALGTSALSAIRTKDTYLAARYHRIAARRGPMRAVVAIEHSILTAAWHMLANGECYTDPGADHFTRINPSRAKNNAIKQLNNLGYNVTITPLTAA
ncbi:IS110 family transposase [Paenarthrobacter ureafaciens]|jgi:transposase|uniref:IS110 family transposase n=3 Tax=Paenarthrobacter TaxID=1742992 RepID=UPI00140A3681|nr:IS110 family transposase [Paenarthrobacter ureafaciens]MCX8456315.1 IS110 family transposase [Paenarthrobacter ureafaciens]MCX8456413.1 IS110 family transposase [Paenarthrobacter ureafaciens]MCY0973515.1 IS110 family transposase [Paenarthrobacter ureafaciens]MCY0973798.1 IS110 family transposase [Paenarthrobacter ureafaciens]MCY0975246.1 IS110 family transposase [Paenarthrobacter ureafaciens]